MDNHIFRSALGGFNRQDVMEYIERTQKQAEADSTRLESQAQELRAALEQSGQALEDCLRQKEELERQLEDMSLQCSHARNNWDAQAQAKESFRRDVADREAAIRELTEANRQLEGRAAELESQLGDLRRQKEQLAQLELDARARSDDVLHTAGAQAQALVSDAQSRAESIVSQAREEAEQALAGARAEAESIVQQARERSEGLLRETQERIDGTAAQYIKLFRAFQSTAGRISGELQKLESTAAQMPSGFSRLLHDFAELQERAKER